MGAIASGPARVAWALATAAVLVFAAACSGAADEPAAAPSRTAAAASSGTAAAASSGTAAGTASNGLGFDDHHVQLRLTRTAPGPATLSFGVPVAPGRLGSADTLAVTTDGRPLDASVTTLLHGHDAGGSPSGVRAVLVQLPASALAGDGMVVDVTWSGGSALSGQRTRFADTSIKSPATARTVRRTIQQVDGKAALVETGQSTVTLFTGREPAVLVDFPIGYLAATGVLGPQTAANVGPAGLAGLQFLSDAATPFGLSAMYAESYALNPDPDSVIVPDAQKNYEGWLYDRCATFLALYAHTGDSRFLRQGYRTCSSYASQISLAGENRGIFTGKAEPDPKYSHLRGLYAYYALTGDESAMAAGQAIADLWTDDQGFAGPYRAGHLRGPDALWTERLLAVSMEGQYFGYLLTDRTDYLDAFRQELDTAYRHITGDTAALAQLNPGTPAFPPQNCFVHTAEQHSEGDATDPWCSGWMSELLIPTLLAYQEQTNDPRIDEVFVRLTRFLRDTGSAYFTGDLLDDTFLHPSVPYAPGESARMLVPLYGAGLGTDNKRHNAGEYDDAQHCADATALTAAGLRGLRRQQAFDSNPIGPFSSEGESFVALEEEFAACAAFEFEDLSRPKRDPATWTSDKLAAGLADPQRFITDNKIGYPAHNIAPERRLSWWFNSGLFDFALLGDAQVRIDTLRPGRIQP